MPAVRPELADDLLRHLVAAVRSSQLYFAGHPIIERNLDLLAESVGLLHASHHEITIGIVESEIIVCDLPGRLDTYAGLVRRLRDADVERLAIARGVGANELRALVYALASGAGRKSEVSPGDVPAPLASFSHIRIGRIQVETRVTGSPSDLSTIRQLYAEAVSAASAVWESAATERTPDPAAARAMVEGLAEAVSANRTALVALTALHEYDNYTFTHMVNVSILTMAQARSVRIDGSLLREFGLAALMHDIGKVRTPAEILTKPDALTEAEFAVMKRHTVDGAEMLRRTPEMPTLVPIVAFEHHLRLDGTGYPDGIRRPDLNLCTMLCSIADVYDAMRSQRLYQQSFPTDRILAVLKRSDGAQFDRHLVRRFVQLLGIYPPGNLVELETGQIAVVLQTHAPDPHRPRVRVVCDRNGVRLKVPYDVNLWETPPNAGETTAVRRPLDPKVYGLDPLAMM